MTFIEDGKKKKKKVETTTEKTVTTIEKPVDEQDNSIQSTPDTSNGRRDLSQHLTPVYPAQPRNFGKHGKDKLQNNTRLEILSISSYDDDISNSSMLTKIKEDSMENNEESSSSEDEDLTTTLKNLDTPMLFNKDQKKESIVDLQKSEIEIINKYEPDSEDQVNSPDKADQERANLRIDLSKVSKQQWASPRNRLEQSNQNFQFFRKNAVVHSIANSKVQLSPSKNKHWQKLRSLITRRSSITSPEPVNKELEKGTDEDSISGVVEVIDVSHFSTPTKKKFLEGQESNLPLINTQAELNLVSESSPKLSSKKNALLDKIRASELKRKNKLKHSMSELMVKVKKIKQNLNKNEDSSS